MISLSKLSHQRISSPISIEQVELQELAKADAVLPCTREELVIWLIEFRDRLTLSWLNYSSKIYSKLEKAIKDKERDLPEDRDKDLQEDRLADTRIFQNPEWDSHLLLFLEMVIESVNVNILDKIIVTEIEMNTIIKVMIEMGLLQLQIAIQMAMRPEIVNLEVVLSKNHFNYLLEAFLKICLKKISETFSTIKKSIIQTLNC